MSDAANRTFCEHMDFAYRIALAATGNPAEAEDSVQDAYFGFIRSWPSFDQACPVEPFLAQIVARTASNRARGERRQASREDARAREDAMTTSRSSAASAEDLAAPLDSAQGGELVERVRAAVAALPEGERLAVSLRYLEGLTIEETAAALALPRSTVSDRVHRGLDLLRKALAAAGFGAAATPAALAALPKLAAPASLKASLAGLMAGAARESVAATEAAKGGLLVKIGLGVAAVGLAAGVAFWAVGGKSEEPAKPKAPSAAEGTPVKVEKPRKFATPVTDPGAEWEREGNFAGCGLPGYLDGPREGMLTADSVGLFNWFGEGADNRLRTYDPATERYYTVAGTTHGYLDGPFSRARFALNGPNSSYVNSVSGAASPDGRYLYLNEGRLGVMRRLDFQKREVVTFCQDKRASGAMAADSKGNLYVVGWNGGIKMLPDGKIEQLNVNAGELIGHGFCIAYDEKNNRIYGANRGNAAFRETRAWYVGYWDLNAGGKFVGVLPQPMKGETPRARCESGPFEGTQLYCPGGICWGADDPDYRFLYYGGGDDMTFYRLDMEKKVWVVFGSPAPKPPGNYKAARASTNCRFGDRKDLPCLYIQEWSGLPMFDAEGNMYFPEALRQNLIRYKRTK
jgi:RNA polymerase sigma-70 factor (ECF subfamily)